MPGVHGVVACGLRLRGRVSCRAGLEIDERHPRHSEQDVHAFPDRGMSGKKVGDEAFRFVDGRGNGIDDAERSEAAPDEARTAPASREQEEHFGEGKGIAAHAHCSCIGAVFP